MRPSHFSYTFLGTFLIVIFFLQWWQETAYPWELWMVLGIFGIIAILIVASARPAARNAALVIPITLGIVVAFLTVARTTHVATPSTVDFYTGPGEIGIRGTIVDDADRRTLMTNYTVEAHLLKKENDLVHVSGRVLVSIRAGNPSYEYGDDVIMRGTLEQPKNPDGFRYDQYLSRANIYSVMQNAMVEPAGTQAPDGVLRMLYGFRRSLENRINVLFPEPHASLLAGLLVGSRRSMPADLVTSFNATGLTHIVAISGYNITMLVAVIGVLLFWLPLKWRFVPSVLLITGFTILTGASGSAVRAAITGILGLLATQTNRVQTTRLTTLWTAFLLLAWNPKLLWYDAGFQLSFLALIGILEISPLLRPHLGFIPERFGIRESLCLTVSAQMLASPWILFLFGQISLIAPLANLLDPPMVPYAMLLGLLSLGGSIIALPIGSLIAAITWIPLQWIISIARILGSLPFAALQIHGCSTPLIICYFACVAGWILRSILRTTPTTHTEAKSFARSIAGALRLPRAACAGNGTHGR